jgi:hypothetical protein
MGKFVGVVPGGFAQVYNNNPKSLKVLAYFKILAKKRILQNCETTKLFCDLALFCTPAPKNELSQIFPSNNF